MILGISGSPRSNMITETAVKAILEQCTQETKFVSLKGKKIAGCISCLLCASDNVCKVQDDFNEIADLIVKAEAIVIGIPNYYDMPNALSHALLERMFCFRHQGKFLLENKPVIFFSTGYAVDENNSQVLNLIEKFITSNKMQILDRFLIKGYSQCFSCGLGNHCLDGNVVKQFGVVDKITEDMLPKTFNQQNTAVLRCQKAAALLNNL